MRLKKIGKISLVSLILLLFFIFACGGETKVSADEDCPTATGDQKTESGACPGPDIPLSWD
jgi:hypothetical protein